MSLRFLDSFDHYVTADLSEKWSASGGGALMTVSAGTGRRGTKSLRHASFGATYYVAKVLDAQATWIIGFAFQPAALPTSAGANICRLLDGGTTQAALILNQNGTLSVVRSTSTALTDGTSTLSLSVDTYAYIEWKITIANSISAGSCKVRVNGVDWLTVATGQDTQATANATANEVRLGNFTLAGGQTLDFDDVYLCDGQGSVNNDFLGDCRVDALLPNANGDDRDWALSTGTDDFAVLDEAAPNDDTDYAWDDTVGQRLLVGCQNLSALTSPSLKGLMVSASAKKSDAGGRGLGVNVKSGSTASDGPDTVLGTSYAYVTRVLETDPDTSTAWTEAGVNSLQVGVEVTS